MGTRLRVPAVDAGADNFYDGLLFARVAHGPNRNGRAERVTAK
jgi:hypothetical protein